MSPIYQVAPKPSNRYPPWPMVRDGSRRSPFGVSVRHASWPALVGFVVGAASACGATGGASGGRWGAEGG
ncbi:MAG TPA: hypothetical protein PLU22_00200, partial [Polyangiaceae bacterium]|nr:hypothetical protein [Polyangiaceae bacterium]